MKKIFSFFIVLIATLTLVGCNKGPKLYLLNWGEYIDEDLVSQFEELYDIKVVIDTAVSNESMYNKVKSKTTRYDVAIPSDYMIHKLYNEGLLNKLDFEYLPNYDASKFDSNLQALREDYFNDNEDYAVPYFWGTLGIMYKLEYEDLVKENDWEVFFNKDLTGNAKIGMYNSSRDALAVAEMFLGYDINTKSKDDLKAVETLLKAQKYYMWGTDDLKTFVASGNADIALVYSGDFFDILYAYMDDDLDINFSLHVPNKNNVWFDGMVIPTTSKDVVMAHNFINFMIDPINAYENARTVGYCPALTSAYDKMLIDPDYQDVIAEYPYYPGTVTEGTIYEDLGSEIYKEMATILGNVKG